MPVRRASVTLDQGTAMGASGSDASSERRASVNAPRRASVSAAVVLAAQPRRQSVTGGATSAGSGDNAEGIAVKARRASFVDSGESKDRRKSVTDRRGSVSGMASALGAKERGAIAGGLDLSIAAPSRDGETAQAVKAVAMKEFSDRKRAEVAEKLAQGITLDPSIVLQHSFLAKLRDGHNLGVYTCLYSDDGNLMLTGGQDGRVIVWDMPLLEMKKRYDGHSGPVFSVHFWPLGDNERLLTGGQDGTVRMWNKKSGRQMYMCTDHKAPVYAARYSRDGNLFATAGESQQVIVYDGQRIEGMGNEGGRNSKEGMLFVIFAFPAVKNGHTATIRQCVWTTKDRFLITGGDDRTIKVWEVGQAGKWTRDLNGHTGAVHSLALAGTEKLASGSADGTARIWNWKTGACIHTLRGHAGTVYAVAFTPEEGGRRIVTGSHDKSMMIWETETGVLLQKVEGAHKSWIMGLAVKPDGLQIATASGDHTIGLWGAVKPTCWQLSTTRCARFFAKLFNGGSKMKGTKVKPGAS